MARPLEGIKVVEVAMWAFVPACGAALSDLGAEVIKIEAPVGDPIRQLTINGVKPGTGGFSFMWEIFNRGKRSLALDLNAPGAIDVLHRLLDDADVFLTNLLPPTRRKLKVDIDDLMSRHPKLIYALGSGQGTHGPDAEKGGFDSISYWARTGIASAVTPDDMSHPVAMPGGAFGDAPSGAILAGAISAALYRRAMTGEPSVVDTSLFATGMYAMQPGIVGTTFTGTDELRMPPRTAAMNPLVNSYRTSDGRIIALCMLQAQRYWPGFCKAAGRPDLVDHPLYGTDEGRYANIAECIAELDALFASHTLAEWKDILHSQDGQWDIVQKAAEVRDDVAAIANGYIQDVDYGDGRSIKMVATPMQFDRQPLIARPAPALGADSDEVLGEAGYTPEQILDLRIAGVLE